jgi:hypothetical protein
MSRVGPQRPPPPKIYIYARAHARARAHTHTHTHTHTHNTGKLLQRNIQARSCNHCCSGKAVSITYSECVSIALGTQNAMRISHIVVCNPLGSTIFFHIIPYRERFSKTYCIQNTCFDFLINTCLKHFSF